MEFAKYTQLSMLFGLFVSPSREQVSLVELPLKKGAIKHDHFKFKVVSLDLMEIGNSESIDYNHKQQDGNEAGVPWRRPWMFLIVVDIAIAIDIAVVEVGETCSCIMTIERGPNCCIVYCTAKSLT